MTMLMSGLISQQMANGPTGGSPDGVSARLTDEAIDTFFAHHRHTRRR